MTAADLIRKLQALPAHTQILLDTGDEILVNVQLSTLYGTPELTGEEGTEFVVICAVE